MIEAVKQAYEKLAELPFPKAVKNDDFMEWISDLAELDGYYAGMAISLLEGKSINRKRLPSLMIKNRCNSLREQKQIKNECKKKYCS